MLRSLISAFVLALAGAAWFAAAASAEPQYSRAPGNFTLIDHYDGNQRVCCKRGGRDWWSTGYECQRAGGYATANRECRHDDYDEQWGGGNGDTRVCCQRQYYGGYQDWWSTVRECRWAGGYATANKVCRKHTSDPPYQGDRLGNGYGDDPYGNPERRVCCSDGYRASWTSWRECRRIRGQDVANKVCRR